MHYNKILLIASQLSQTTKFQLSSSTKYRDLTVNIRNISGNALQLSYHYHIYNDSACTIIRKGPQITINNSKLNILSAQYHYNNSYGICSNMPEGFK